METHFDPNLPKIDIIPQDFGRVILNLINNAFYAVNERSKKGEEGYQPTVTAYGLFCEMQQPTLHGIMPVLTYIFIILKETETPHCFMLKSGWNWQEKTTKN
jgi:hypothetical protein